MLAEPTSNSSSNNNHEDPTGMDTSVPRTWQKLSKNWSSRNPSIERHWVASCEATERLKQLGAPLDCTT